MLSALSPLDGRYQEKTRLLAHYFSEMALMRYRLLIEIRWIEMLSLIEDIPECRAISEKEITLLQEIFENFSPKDAERIKEIESITRHDVKAIEYFLKERLEKTSLKDISEWVHFACTSEDINNLAYSLMMKDAIEQVILPSINLLFNTLHQRAKEWKGIPLLSLTHGQPASPTTLGKALFVFVSRLSRQIFLIDEQEFLGKWNGATGNFNAHHAAFPDIEWLEISEEFVSSLGLSWNPITEQIEPHDFLAEIFHSFSRCNTILVDLSRDMWGYISRGIFSQQLKEGEVGSSAMPHKINPIDFENAEGNFLLANALFGFFAEKLPVSRFQRDLTDSTVLRNVGTAFGHTLIALQSLQNGFEKVSVNIEKTEQELEENEEVLAEAVQTVLRKCGVEKPYEKLKALTRGKRISRKSFQEFVKDLKIPPTEKKRLLSLTPDQYTGLAADIVDIFATSEG
jgi:adenylosuccinate lyase